jgi:hypothetical protein
VWQGEHGRVVGWWAAWILLHYGEDFLFLAATQPVNRASNGVQVATSPRLGAKAQRVRCNLKMLSTSPFLPGFKPGGD